MRFKKEWFNLLLIISLFVNAWLPVYAATGSTEMASAARPPASPTRQGVCPGVWRYPLAVTDPGGNIDIGQNPTYTSVTPHLALGPEDDQGAAAQFPGVLSPAASVGIRASLI